MSFTDLLGELGVEADAVLDDDGLQDEVDEAATESVGTEPTGDPQLTVEIVDFETDSVGIVDKGDPIILPTVTAGQGFEITFDVQVENVGEGPGTRVVDFSDETDRDPVGPQPVGLSPADETVDLSPSETELLEFTVKTFTAQDYNDGDEFTVELDSGDDSVTRSIKIEEEDDNGIPVDPVL